MATEKEGEQRVGGIRAGETEAGRLRELSQQSRWLYEDQAIKVLNSLSSVYTFHMGNGTVKQEPDFKTFVGYNR